MPAYIGIGGAWKEIVSGTSIGVGGVNKTIQTMHIGVGGAWKSFFSAGVVTVSGELITATAGSGPVNVKLIINTDGTLDKDENGVIAQIDSGTDWIIPNGAASSSYQVRYTNFTGNALQVTTTLTEDVWAAIDQNHEIILVRTGAEGNGQDVATFDLEIRLGTGATLDSGSFTMQAEIT